MRSARRLLPFVLSLVTIISINLSIKASDDDGEDYDVKVRVMRVSLVKGEVNLKRNGNTDWERVRLNFPLVEGDTIATDRDSRAEIQVDGRNFVRLDAETTLQIVTLRDEGVALSVIQGTASVRLAQFDHDHEYFEVDAPRTTLAAQKKGLYRIDVSREGRVRLTVRDGGNARIYSETSGFALRDGRTAELIFDGTDAGDWELSAASVNDNWDHWVDDRERYLARRLRYDTQYYDQYVWGAEDLDAYGQWAYTPEYGWIWQPNTSVINSYDNWAPYRYGNWVWCSPYGWTWVGYEPWGWAPYHYGRWVYYNNYWAWCPRSEFYRHRSWWRPALVAFNISFGNEICWYPLSYHHRDPRSRNYDRDRDGRLRGLRGDDLANLRRINPANLRAVTAVRARDFGSPEVRLQPATDQLARHVVSAEPMRADLPVRPANAVGSDARPGTERIVARPPRVSPDVPVPDRPTGAMSRTPGVPLDAELRRTRVLNGREMRPTQPSTPGDLERGDRPTGVVTRPPRSTQRDQPPVNNDEVPARPDRTYPRQPPRNPENVEPRDRNPVTTPERRNPEETRPTTRPGKNERRERIDRPEREVRPPVERPTVEERRSERPTQRVDPPVRYEPPARSEPAPRNDPPPRTESPRNEPPPRNDPPPRTESPRNEPAPRAEPPQRSEPPARVERRKDP